MSCISQRWKGLNRSHCIIVTIDIVGVEHLTTPPGCERKKLAHNVMNVGGNCIKPVFAFPTLKVLRAITLLELIRVGPPFLIATC
jgi:hypothetical protein